MFWHHTSSSGSPQKRKGAVYIETDMTLMSMLDGHRARSLRYNASDSPHASVARMVPSVSRKLARFSAERTLYETKGWSSLCRAKKNPSVEPRLGSCRDDNLKRWSNKNWSSDPKRVSKGVMTPRKIPVDQSMSCTVGSSSQHC